MDIGFVLTVIWPYLVALYLLDCVLFVRGSQLLFTGTAPSGFRVRGPGLRLAGMLPWDWSVLTAREPLVLSETGIYARADSNPDPFRPPGPDDFEFIPWEKAGKVETDGKQVVVNGRQVFAASTRIEASVSCRRILKLRGLSAEGRVKALQEDFATINDIDSIPITMEAIKKSASFLSRVSAVLFFWTLFLLPVSLLLRLAPLILWMEVVVFLAGWFTIMVLWWRVHLALFPEAAGDRLEEMFVFLFFPVSALHAFGKLTRRVLAAYDSTALIAALAPSSARESLEKEHIRAAAAASSRGSEDFTAVWKMRVRTLEELAGKTRVNLTGAELTPVAPGSEEMACPLCGSRYREGIKECADCLIPLTVPKIPRVSKNCC